MYSVAEVESLCPWCIADGSAAEKYEAGFVDAYFCDSDGKHVDLPDHWHEAVFERTIGFATFNPIGGWIHGGEPAEYVTRDEPYDMVFECRVCHQRQVMQVIEDYD